MNHPLISIIVPVYNTEKYLHRCVDSILAQTYTDFELLLIDDGSSDNSGHICDEYALKDIRVRVYHQDNGGVSCARNLGLDNAKGDWITFIDSDDWIENEYLFRFRAETDLSLQGYSSNDHIAKYRDTIVGNNPGAEYLYRKYVFGPYCKLFRKDIIRDKEIRFDSNISCGEDILFLMEYMVHAKNMDVSSYVGYHYDRHDDSLSSSIKPYKSMCYMYKKHIPLFEELLKNSKHRLNVMRKEVIGMFFHFIIDQKKNIDELVEDAFFERCFNLYLNNIDKFILKKCSCYLVLYKKFLNRFDRLIC